MTNEIDNNAISVKDAFNNPKEKTNHENNKETVTKAEIEALEAQRAKPTSGMQLTPIGELNSNIHKEIERQNELRIDALKKHLNEAKGLAKDDFDRSR